MARLEPKHIKKISDAYWKFKDIDGFAKVIAMKDVLENNGNLSVQLYVKQSADTIDLHTEELIAHIKTGQQQINESLENLYAQLRSIGIEA